MATTTKKSRPKKICDKCGKSYSLTQFYEADTTFFPDGKLHVCKKCVYEIVEEKGFEGFKSLLRLINKPFIAEMYKDDVKSYLKVINSLPQYKNQTYDDSQFIKDKINKQKKSIEINNDEIVYDEEMVRKWGNGYTHSDIDYLENFFFEYARSYPTDTPTQINLYKSIAKTHLQAEKELANKNIKNYKDLMELSSKLHNDGNIKPIQSTGANDDKGLSTYGLWIREIEKEEPCEYFENKPIYEDYDKLKRYLEKWFIRPFKNIFNISKDFNVNDDD
ncbi:hypothetical protein [Bacillus smithii]|uniref:hypothetical protein n=1 Tax=Bacillus smithii TaxID=1479 RepID=UPI003D1CE0EA